MSRAFPYLLKDGEELMLFPYLPRDTLRGETIGMIVGIVLAVLLLIVVCLVLIFLKATERLCFADNDQSYRYHDPKSKRAQPHNAQVSRLPKIFVGWTN